MITQTKFRTPWERRPITGEVNTLPSLTKPDMVMSIKDMLKRHISGIGLQGTPVDYDFDGENDEDINQDFIPENYRDQIDRDNLAQDLATRKRELATKVKTEKAAHAKAAQELKEQQEAEQYERLRKKFTDDASAK